MYKSHLQRNQSTRRVQVTTKYFLHFPIIRNKCPYSVTVAEIETQYMLLTEPPGHPWKVNIPDGDRLQIMRVSQLYNRIRLNA